jgi:hypothetical protein
MKTDSLFDSPLANVLTVVGGLFVLSFVLQVSGGRVGALTAELLIGM